MRPFRQRVMAHLRYRAAAYLVLLVALVPAGVAYWRALENVRGRTEARFNALTVKAEETIRDSFNELAADLRAVGGFIEASESITRSEWNVFIGKLDLSRRHPGIRSIGFAERVVLAERTAFLERMRASAGPAYDILPSAVSAISFPTVFVTQMPTNIDAKLGWDSYSELLRKEALNIVMRTGRAAITAKAAYRSLQNGRAQGFTMFAPTYRNGTNQIAAPELDGVVFSSFIPQDMFQTFSNRELAGLVGIELFDGADAMPEAWLGGSGTVSNREPMLHKEVPIRLFDHLFLLRVSSLPEFETSTEGELPAAVGACGVAFSFLLFGIAWVQGNARSAADALNRHLHQSQEQLQTANAELQRKIADAKIAEGLLAHERDLLRMLLDYSPDSIYFKDRDSRFIRCGKGVLRHLGVDEISSKSDFDFFTEEHAAATRAIEKEVIRTGRPVTGLVERELWPDGRETWVLTSKMPLRDNEGNIIGTFGISKDITELKAAELALAKEKELLAVTLRSIGDAVIATDVEGGIVLLNGVAEQITGWSQAEAFGRLLTDVFQMREHDDTPLRRHAFNDTAPQSVREALLITRVGGERNISQSLAPIIGRDGQKLGAVLVFRDVTEKLKIEAELVKASKLESIGVLAGGIAHDFNNILTVILGNLSLARLSASAGLPLTESLQEAENASLRARELTQRLLTFAKGGAPIKKPLDVSHLVRASAQALQGTGVTPEFFISEGLWLVEADEAQISQVVQNLISYARASMHNDPRLDIHVLNQEIADDPLLLLKPGKYVRISIRDYGAGIQEENLTKIFDPYFGARKHGSGLELATAYSIVRKHEGQIRVESISGQGTIFHVYLPAAITVADAATPSLARASEPANRMSRRVLVMDDELPIRKLAAHMLRHIGCTVEMAADGVEAVAMYDAALHRGNRFDVVIMDLTVPNGMGGKEAIRQLKAIDPDVTAIVSSGYSNDPVMANFSDFGFAGVVPKPYTKEHLAVALAEVVDSVGGK